MAVNSFILYNGEYHFKDEFGLSYKNRAFCYGDALFETMHANGTEIQFFSDHITRLKYGMDILKMKIPPVIETGIIEKEIIKLLHKNKLYQGVRIRLTVFRNEGGKYTPHDNSVSYLVETEYLENHLYEINQKGLVVDLFKDIKKPVNAFANLKSANALIYILAGLHAKNENLGDCIILNEDEHIVETVSSNIFIIKGDRVSTPSLKDGPVAGIMRKQILQIADKYGLKVSYDNSLKESDLLNADEVFLTNAIQGIRWVLAYKDRRYFNNISRQFADKLNMEAFSVSRH